MNISLKIINLAFALTAGCLYSCSSSTSSTSEGKRPNIILIMADDMGYSDIGSYGGEIETPNIDQLSAKGISFTQFYNAARCCPTRASLLTGLYPHEAGMGGMTGRNSGAGYQGYLNKQSVTLAEVLGEAGYNTGMVGKWHVGNLREAWPGNRGFDYFYGTHNYIDSYFKVLADCEIYENGKIVIPESDHPARDLQPEKEWYTTDVFTDKALAYINKSAKASSPFFLYTAYNAPHWPLEAHDSVVRKYIRRYNDGWNVLRNEKYKRMVNMGLIQKNWELPPMESPEWSTLSDSAKQNAAFRRAIYAAQIDIMDQNIGRIVDALKQNGIYDNTLILFLSDNGCSAEPEHVFGGYNFGKNTRWNYEGWRRSGARKGASQGIAWAEFSNAPFRKYKKFIHEGGISTPFIMSWPKRIKDRGRLVSEPGHVVDVMATLIDIADAEYPQTFHGNAIKAIKGTSLVPLFIAGSMDERSPIYWEHEKHAGMRAGDWKLVTVNALKDDRWELYNMKNDRNENNNLIEKHPEKAKAMKDKWQVWAKASNVIPWPEKGTINPIDK